MIFRKGQCKKVHLPDRALLRHMAVIMAITFGYLIAWTAANNELTTLKETSSGLKFVMCIDSWWSYSAYGSIYILFWLLYFFLRVSVPTNGDISTWVKIFEWDTKQYLINQPSQRGCLINKKASVLIFYSFLMKTELRDISLSCWKILQLRHPSSCLYFGPRAVCISGHIRMTHGFQI